MEITFSNLHTAIAALRQCASENKNSETATGSIRVSDLCDDVADYLERNHIPMNGEGLPQPIGGDDDSADGLTPDGERISRFESRLRNDMRCFVRLVAEGRKKDELSECIKLWANGLMAAAREQIAREIDLGKMGDDYRRYLERELGEGRADESKVVSYQLGLTNARKIIREDTVVW